MSEIKEPININENLIKFKAWSFYGNPNENPPLRLFDVFNNIKIAKNESMNLLIRLKRIREALEKESKIIDQARMELMSEIAVKDENGQPKMADNKFVFPEEPEAIAELNRLYLELMNQDISLPFEKIKSSQIVGIESLKELDLLEGIIEIVET